METRLRVAPTTMDGIWTLIAPLTSGLAQVADFEEVIILPAIFGVFGTIVWLAALGNRTAGAQKIRYIAYGLLALAFLFGFRHTLNMLDGVYRVMINQRRVAYAHWAAGLGPLIALAAFFAIDFFRNKGARTGANLPE
ncbi:MAG: hypothetical protein KIS66_11455 [Fimbriimonadaceae bacterium]|nr:hypothetical protein [Fimbriimonadaceae bacterium]